MLSDALNKPMQWASRKLPLHLLDEGAGIGFWAKVPFFQVFPGGWGGSYSKLQEIFTIQPAGKIPQLKIQWETQRQTSKHPYREGTFMVPQSEGLPEPIRKAHFRYHFVTAKPHPKLCLLLAGWGEHGYNLRMRLSRALWHRGIDTVLLENPFHGKRRMPDRPGSPVLTVAESGILVHAAIYEGMALLNHFSKKGYEVGVAGFSMGGSIAAWIRLRYPKPIPTTLLAPPHSPEIGLLGDIIKKGIMWDKLDKYKNPQQRLKKLLQRVSLLNADPPKGNRPIIIVAARDDRVVSPASVEKFHRYWPTSQLRWVPGGHVSMLLFEVEAMADAIAQTFES